MLRYIQRGSSQQPIPGVSPWLSRLLQNRGIDTPEKVACFLAPSMDQLLDPFLMQDMDKAVTLIRGAVEAKTPICVYGDYDVDGVCASSIMLETLRGMGADVAVRIPNRSEGYGMNLDAVRQMHEQGIGLLITVDCGITNHAEVTLARSLGMTVIVTDHHELGETVPQANAVLNPKLGSYPFRHLCGAGVALKITQALGGLDEAAKHIDLAALATVADMVMMTDENRVIVREGLRRCADTDRRGLRALMRLASVGGQLVSDDVSFKIAPRINAGGRLETAAPCVRMLTENTGEAEQIADHLNRLNSERQAEQQHMLQEAEVQVSRWSFRDHLVLFAQGKDWNRGIIGLTAGRLCEKWHYPTIVFSDGEDGLSVGSCRSIEGVHMHGVLSDCARRYRENNGTELFEKFGGHAMAAGLTIRTGRIPELLRLMDLVIADLCDDLTCYVPSLEYDCSLSLQEVTLETVAELDQLQPTGYGNPAPVFRCSGAHVNEMRRCGDDGSHLRLTLVDGGTVRQCIAFHQGDAADEPIDTADVLFVPQRNEFRGKVSPQMEIKAIRAASGSSPVPAENVLFRSLLQEIDLLTENIQQNQAGDLPVVTDRACDDLLRSGRGVLFLCHERNKALEIAAKGIDVRIGLSTDPRGFNTVLCGPDLTGLKDEWRQIIFADGSLPGEADLVRQACPAASLYAMKNNPLLSAALQSWILTREQLGGLYTRVAKSTSRLMPVSLAQSCGLTPEQLHVALTSLAWAGLIRYTPDPWLAAPLPRPAARLSSAQSPVNSPLLNWLRGLK